jgi:HKD family nuclease
VEEQVSAPNITTCFKADIAFNSVGNSSIVIGGTQLLNEFIRLLDVGGDQSSLTIVVPFLDEESLRHLCSAMADKSESVALQLITSPGSTARTAVRILTSMKWRSCVVKSVRGLHSKVYIASSPGRCNALIGSHNLTKAGRGANFEVGVLLFGCVSEIQMAIQDLEASVVDVMRYSKTEYDSFNAFAEITAA